MSPPVSDGSGLDRKLLQKASRLLDQAGWKLNGPLRRNDKGEPLRVEFLLEDPAFERIIGPYVQSLRRIGVEALGRFKSGANIALLKHYLDDAFLESYWDVEQNVYSVRKMALEALRKWGVTVAQPQLHPDPEAPQRPQGLGPA